MGTAKDRPIGSQHKLIRAYVLKKGGVKVGRDLTMTTDAKIRLKRKSYRRQTYCDESFEKMLELRMQKGWLDWME